MPLGSDPAMPAILVIASLITLVMFNGLGVVAAFLLWRHAAAVRRRDPAGAAQPGESLAFLFYLLSAVFWVAALVCSIMFLRNARTARAGAICGTLGVAQVVLIAWGVCIPIIVFAEDLVAFLPP